MLKSSLKKLVVNCKRAQLKAAWFNSVTTNSTGI